MLVSLLTHGFTHRFWAYLKKVPFLVLMLAALFIGSLLLFAAIVHEVLRENEQGFDQQVFSFFQGHIISSALTPVMKIVTFLGSSPFQLVLYPLLICFYLLRRNKMVALDILMIGLSGFICMFLLKDIFHRARPANPLIDPLRSYSFPSGHASSGFILYGLIAYLILQGNLPKWLKYTLAALLILLSLLIGFSRIYLHVHYASDVLAGFCLGFAWLALSISILKYFHRKTLPKEHTSMDHSF